MLKVVVFDSGWGGEMFADYLEERVPVVEVTRVIDWRKAPYSKCVPTDICFMTERALRPYIGEVDVIVLASYAVTVAALAYLRWRYPDQKFVGFEMRLSEYVVGQESIKNVMVLAAGVVEDSISFEREMFEMKHLIVVHPTCLNWIQKVDDGEMDEKALRKELGEFTNLRVDAILLYSTGFVDIKPILEKIYKVGVVIDDFERVVQWTCTALRLRGGDGTRRALK